eukprot:991564-Prymnesium_polylepis.2
MHTLDGSEEDATAKNTRLTSQQSLDLSVNMYWSASGSVGMSSVSRVRLDPTILYTGSSGSLTRGGTHLSVDDLESLSTNPRKSETAL